MFRKWAQVHFFSCLDRRCRIGPGAKDAAVAADELDRYALADRLFELLAPDLAAEAVELVDVRVFRGGGRLQVRLSVDRAGGEAIDLDGCATASRTAGMLLEEADLMAGPYVLEVSSPGVRRPLRTDAHLQAAVGRDVALVVRGGERRPRRLRGRLEAFGGGRLTVAPLQTGADAAAAEAPARGAEAGGPGAQPYGPPEVIARADVLEANLDTELDVQALINADRRRRKQQKRQARQQRQSQSSGRVRSKTRRDT
jgi:ribosome maturation factor RimP